MQERPTPSSNLGTVGRTGFDLLGGRLGHLLQFLCHVTASGTFTVVLVVWQRHGDSDNGKVGCVEILEIG